MRPISEKQFTDILNNEKWIDKIKTRREHRHSTTVVVTEEYFLEKQTLVGTLIRVFDENGAEVHVICYIGDQFQ